MGRLFVSKTGLCSLCPCVLVASKIASENSAVKPLLRQALTKRDRSSSNYNPPSANILIDFGPARQLFSHLAWNSPSTGAKTRATAGNVTLPSLPPKTPSPQHPAGPLSPEVHDLRGR